MREQAYAAWLQHQVSPRVRADYLSRCRRVEIHLHIDLDRAFGADQGAALLDRLTYTADDRAQGRPPRCEIPFRPGANIKAGMSSLKSAVNNYFDFCRQQVFSAPLPQNSHHKNS